MGGGVMEAPRNIKRQPAWHIFASEFGEATLNERGSGEYDPSFVITRLGAKINRVLVAGLLERVEPRESANGQVMHMGQLRDPSGLFYFSAGDFDPESARGSHRGPDEVARGRRNHARDDGRQGPLVPDR